MATDRVRHRDGLTAGPDDVNVVTAPFSSDDMRAIREMLTRAAGAGQITIEARLALAERWARDVLADPELDVEKVDALLVKAKQETLEWYAAKALHNVEWARLFLKNGQVDQALREAFDAGFRFALGQCKEVGEARPDRYQDQRAAQRGTRAEERHDKNQGGSSDQTSPRNGR